jgi:hypothetical protein
VDAAAAAASAAIKQGVQQRIKAMLEEKLQEDSRVKEIARKRKESELLNKIKKKKQREEDHSRQKENNDLRQVIEVKAEAAAAAAYAASMEPAYIALPPPPKETSTTDLRQVIEDRRGEDHHEHYQRRVVLCDPPAADHQHFTNGNSNHGVVVSRAKTTATVRNVTMLDSRPERGNNTTELDGVSLPGCSQACPMCWTRFLSVDDLLVHFRAAHAGHMFACLLCQRGDTQQDSLGWALDIMLKHLAVGHNVKADADEAFKQEFVCLPGREDIL